MKTYLLFLVLYIACNGVQSDSSVDAGVDTGSVIAFCEAYLDGFDKEIGSYVTNDSTNSTILVDYFYTSAFVCRVAMKLNDTIVTQTSAIPIKYFCEKIFKAPTDNYIDGSGVPHYPSRKWISLTLMSNMYCSILLGDEYQPAPVTSTPHIAQPDGNATGSEDNIQKATMS